MKQKGCLLMNAIIAAFKSKNQMIQFDSALRKKGIATKIISTPRAIALGCGLSVEIQDQDLQGAKDIISKSNFTAFEGFYQIIKEGNRVRVVRIFS